MTDQTGDSVEELLPFYVNGTLSQDEVRSVEAALADRPDLQAEVEALRAMRRTMQSEEIRSPGEFGLARLRRDIRSETQAQPQQRGHAWIWPAAAAVGFALFLGQTFLTLGPGAPSVELAGADAPAVITAGFVPEATEADIRALLLDLELEIVSGPSALGLYGLQALEGTDIADLVQRLEEADGLVDTVDWEGD